MTRTREQADRALQEESQLLEEPRPLLVLPSMGLQAYREKAGALGSCPGLSAPTYSSKEEGMEELLGPLKGGNRKVKK